MKINFFPVRCTIFWHKICPQRSDSCSSFCVLFLLKFDITLTLNWQQFFSLWTWKFHEMFADIFMNCPINFWWTSIRFLNEFFVNEVSCFWQTFEKIFWGTLKNFFLRFDLRLLIFNMASSWRFAGSYIFRSCHVLQKNFLTAVWFLTNMIFDEHFEDFYCYFITTFLFRRTFFLTSKRHSTNWLLCDIMTIKIIN